MHTPVNLFYYIKVGGKGLSLHGLVFVMYQFIPTPVIPHFHYNYVSCKLGVTIVQRCVRDGYRIIDFMENLRLFWQKYSHNLIFCKPFTSTGVFT